MGSADEVEVGALQELGDDIGPEGERHTAVALTPPLGIRVRVRPQEVAGQPSVRDLRRPLDLPQLLQGLQLGGKACDTARRTLALSGLRTTRRLGTSGPTGVDTEDFLLDDGGEG